MVAEIEEKDFASEVLDSAIPVVVDFFAPWCTPCQPQGDMMDRLAEQYGSRVKFLKVDVDKNQDLADKLSVRSVPTLLFFNHDEVGAQVGLTTEEKVKAKIEEFD